MSEFASKKRELLLEYGTYEFMFDDLVDGFAVVRKSLSRLELCHSFNPYQQMVPVKQRAWDSLDFLVTCYSAGHPLLELRDIYPSVLEYWQIYLNRFQKYLNWEKNGNKDLAALPLLGYEYQFANQLVCFGILLGWGGVLDKILAIIDINNIRPDGMIERLLRPYVEDRGNPPAKCTRHLPYLATLKIFDADAHLRAEMMKEYIQGWYQASRHEGYYGSHKRSDDFKGYWSWEAAAITYLLDIDDSTYRDAKYYPAELVEFARSIKAPRTGQTPSTNEDLRVKSGRSCPKSGMWETLDIPLKRRQFTAGQVVQGDDPSYRVTEWRYSGR